MKRALLLTGMALLLTVANAQQDKFFLERNDMSYAGADFQMQWDSNFTLPASFPQGGDSLRWDFSTAASNYGFVTRFLAPNSTNGGDQVSNCNLVIQDDGNVDEYNYVNESATAIWILNTNMDTFGLEGDLGRHRAVVFPLSRDTAWSDTSSGKITYAGSDVGVPFDSMRITVTLQINSFCDASGWLILPVDSVFALRVRQEITADWKAEGYYSVSGWFPVQSGSENSQTFSFYSDECGFRLANIDPDPDEPTKSEVRYRSQKLVSNRIITGSVDVPVYPNPADASLNLEVPHAGTAQIVDITGKAMGNTVTLEAGRNTLNTSALSSGSYFIRVQLQNGQTQTVKFIKR